MNNKYSILFVTLLLLLWQKQCFGRVVYVQIHAEKPGTGSEDEKVEGGSTMSSMEGLGHPSDGLGYTGMLRAACMTNNFGPNAPFYRQPKRIITQHFILQNNGDFINNGHRGHHTSRRMYHQTYALALSLGIDPDEEVCCGGGFDDIINYIYNLPPEDDPILIVNQHGVANTFIKGYALSYGYDVETSKFGRHEDKIWTMIDGQFVEEWFMCCDAIPSSRCTGNNVQPAWVNSYKFPSGAQRAPLVKEVEYPSWIFTPSNMKNSIGWNYNSYLRKRGVWSGEECFNEDLVKPNANVTNFDLRKIEKRDEDEENIGFSDHSKHEKREESSSVINSISKIAEIIIAIVTIVFLYNI